jgi:hypothetical protein
VQTELTSTSERANVSKGATPPPCPIAMLTNAKKKMKLSTMWKSNMTTRMAQRSFKRLKNQAPLKWNNKH